jgi:hypothetical protein
MPRTRNADERRADVLRAGGSPYATEDGAPVAEDRAVEDASSDPSLRKARSEALGAVDYYTQRDQLNSTAADRLDGLIRRDGPRALAGRYLTAIGDPAYLSAFGKLLADPTTGHLRFSAKEAEAVRLVNTVEAERALNVTTGSAGQFAISLTLDPTILLSSAGVISPIRQLAPMPVQGGDGSVTRRVAWGVASKPRPQQFGRSACRGVCRTSRSEPS